MENKTMSAQKNNKFVINIQIHFRIIVGWVKFKLTGFRDPLKYFNDGVVARNPVQNKLKQFQGNVLRRVHIPTKRAPLHI